MKEHKLKIWSQYFNDVLSGAKKAEHRINDRDFKVGDTLCLEEVTKPDLEYTGRRIYVYITHIIPCGEMAILSIEPCDTEFKPATLSVMECAEAMQKEFPIVQTGQNESGNWCATPLGIDVFILATNAVLKSAKKQGVKFDVAH